MNCTVCGEPLSAHRRGLRVLALLLFLVLPGILSGCRFLLSLSGPVPVGFREQILTLSWDARQTGIEGTPSATSHFDIYYRPYGKTSWTYLQSTVDFRSRVSIMHDRLGDGDFEFGVRTVYSSGRKSDIHGSTDFAAWPPGGWYLRWRSQ